MKKMVYVIFLITGIMGLSLEQTSGKARPLFLDTYSVKETTILPDEYTSFKDYLYTQSKKKRVVKLADSFEHYNFHFYNSYTGLSKTDLSTLTADQLPGFYLVFAVNRYKKVVRYLVHFNQKKAIDLIGFFHYTSRNKLNQVVIYTLSPLNTGKKIHDNISYRLQKIVKSHVVTHTKHYSRIINYYYTNNRIDYFINIKNNHRKQTSILHCYSLKSRHAKQPIYELHLKKENPEWARIYQFSFKEKMPPFPDTQKYLFSPQIDFVTTTNLYAYACKYYFNVRETDSCQITVSSFHKLVASDTTLLYPASSALSINDQEVMNITSNANAAALLPHEGWVPDLTLTLGNNIFTRTLKDYSSPDNSFNCFYQYCIDNTTYRFSAEIPQQDIYSVAPQNIIHWDNGIRDFFYRLDYLASKKKTVKGTTWHIDSRSMHSIDSIINNAGEHDILLIKTGIYHISKPLLFHNKKDLILRGDGTVRIVLDSSDPAIISLQNSRNMLIQNISFSHKKQTASANDSTAVLSLDRSYFITIDGCELYGADRFGVDSTASAHITIRNSYIHHNAIAAFAIDTISRDIVITRNRLIKNPRIFFQEDNVDINNTIVFNSNSVW